MSKPKAKPESAPIILPNKSEIYLETPEVIPTEIVKQPEDWTTEDLMKLTSEQRREIVKEIRKVGRPSKYRPEFCAKLIEHMKAGFSFKSFASEVDVDGDTVYQWAEEYPEFSFARKKGDSFLLKYDEKLLDDLSKGTYGRAASAATHLFKLKNLHGWRDKQEIEQTNKNIQIDVTPDDQGL